MSSEFIPEKTKEVKAIPKDLQDKWGSVQACATAFNCLDQAYLPHKYHTVAKQSLAFLMKLHEQCVEDALKHPQAHMISELKEMLKTKESNGQEKDETGHGTGANDDTDIHSTDHADAGATQYS